MLFYHITYGTRASIFNHRIVVVNILKAEADSLKSSSIVNY